MGYTFWISINPLSDNFSDQFERNRVQSILHTDNIEIDSSDPFGAILINYIYLMVWEDQVKVRSKAFGQR